jgi:hypothetical protein
MANPYTQVDIQNYNLNPPPDDATQVSANLITWDKHKTKLSDPIKTAVESIDDNVSSAFGKVTGGITSVANDYSVLSTDQGKIIVVTVSGKIVTTPDATSVGSGFKIWVLNNSSGNITIDGYSTQTIDGTANITVPAGKGVALDNNGSNWFTDGQNWTVSLAISALTSGVMPAGVGAAATSYAKGTVSSGTYTPLYSDGNFQHYTNGGAHTLAPPANICTLVIECTNASAGAITTSGFSIVDGDTYSSSGTKKHLFYITKTQNYSRLTVVYVTGT